MLPSSTSRTRSDRVPLLLILVLVGGAGYLLYSKQSSKFPSTSTVTPRVTATAGKDEQQNWETVNRQVEARWSELDRLARDGGDGDRKRALAEKLHLYESVVGQNRRP